MSISFSSIATNCFVCSVGCLRRDGLLLSFWGKLLVFRFLDCFHEDIIVAVRSKAGTSMVE